MPPTPRSAGETSETGRPAITPRRAPSPEERRRDADRTRAQLLAAAFEEFAAKGFAGARVQDIASRAGVDKQLISYYFGGKQGLYRDVLRHQLETEAAVNDPQLPLPEVAARYVRHALADARMTRLLLWAGLSDQPENLPAGSLEISTMIDRQRRGELGPDLDPASVLLTIIGAVTAAVALPQVVKALFDLDPTSSEFEDRYTDQLRVIIERLVPDRNRDARCTPDTAGGRP